MSRTGSYKALVEKALLAGLVGLALPAVLPAAQQAAPVPAGTPVTITVKPAETAAPPVTITLGARHGHVTPTRCGCTHTGGGNIDIAQPATDTVVVTMSGVAVAYPTPKGSAATLTFDLDQCLEVAYDTAKLKRAKITLEGRVIGLLRSHCKGGTAEYSNACASVGADTVGQVITLCVPPHSVVAGENLGINDHDGPVSAPIVPGKYTLRQTFCVTAAAPKSLLPCKAPSAEFAPDPALDPLWISYKEPFHGAAKKDFGFQVTLRIVEDTDAPANGDAKTEEKKP